MAADNKTTIHRPQKQVLDTFYGLSSYDGNARNAAAAKLLTELKKSKTKGDEFSYCLDRLVKGLASPREAARLGFCVVLTELLKTNEKITCDEIYVLMDKHLPLSKSAGGENGKNNAIGQMLCALALIRSKKCVQALEKTMQVLSTLRADRPYLELPWAQALVSISLLVDEDTFKTIVWPSIKTDCNVPSLDSCTPSKLWILIELEKAHSKFIRKKAKLFRGEADNNWPAKDEGRLRKIGDILAAGIRSSSSGVHPLERSLLSAMISGDDGFEHYWEFTICGSLMKNDDKLVSVAGIRAIGEALSMQPGKKQLEAIFSLDTLRHLLKSLLDRMPASRFARSAAWNQLATIENYVSSNRANPSIQFLILKQLLGASLNFDGVTGSNMIHRLLANLSNEAASMTAEFLISKLAPPSSGGGSADAVVIVKLLVRLFECSKFTTSSGLPKKESSSTSNNIEDDDEDYRSKILKLLATEAFLVSQQQQNQNQNGRSKSSSADHQQSANRTAMKNGLMRCLSSLAIVFTLQRGRISKFDFPPESIAAIGRVIDTLIDRKKGIGRGDRSILAAENEERKELAMKAAKVFHKIRKSLVVEKEEREKEDQNQNQQNQAKCFLILIGYTLLWFLDEPDEYQRALADVLVCWEKCGNADEQEESQESWRDVLVDVMLNMLSRPHRHIRTPMQVAFHYLCPCLKFENISPLLQALKPSEKENLVVTEEDEDSEMEEEEVEHGNGKASGESSDVDDEEEEQESNDEDAVDPQLRRDIEDALGDAAINSDTASIASDFSDTAMLKLDEHLSAVFRSHLSRESTKRSARDLAEQAQAFRVRCFDLLFVLFNSNPSPDLIINLILPLLNIANEAVKSGDTNKNLFHRANQSLQRLVQMKDIPPAAVSITDFADRLRVVIEELINFARNFATACANPTIRNSVSECLRFLLKQDNNIIGENNKQAIETFQTDIRRIIGDNLKDYLQNRLCLLPTTVFVAAFQKKTILFAENLLPLIDAAFDTSIRPYRRHESCALIKCLLNKQAISSITGDKREKKLFASTWTVFLDRLRSKTLSMIENFSADQEAEKEEEHSDSASASKSSSLFKIGDVFEIFNVLRIAANLEGTLADLSGLKEEDGFVEKLEKFGSSDSSTIGQKMGKIGDNRGRFSKLCGEVVKKLRGGGTKIGPTAEAAEVVEAETGKEDQQEEEELEPVAPKKKRRKENVE